jgi:hypothetical protein
MADLELSKSNLLYPDRTNKLGHVQYRHAETLEEEDMITWDDLHPERVWVIKNPRKECLEAVCQRIPGCTLFNNPGRVVKIEDLLTEKRELVQKPALFLLSPKASFYYDVEPTYSETVIITFTAEVLGAASTVEELTQTSFFLFKSKGGNLFHNLTVHTTKNEPPGSAIVKAVKKRLGLNISATWLSTQGTVMIKNKYNRILQLPNLIHTTVFHLNLRDHQVSWALKVLEAHELRPPLLPSTYVHTLKSGHKVMLLLHSDFLDIKYMTSNMNFVQLECMLRCFNKTLGPLPFIEKHSLKPFLHYSRRPLELVG